MGKEVMQMAKGLTRAEMELIQNFDEMGIGTVADILRESKEHNGYVSIEVTAPSGKPIGFLIGVYGLKGAAALKKFMDGVSDA